MILTVGLYLFITGLIMGSFLNVLADRWSNDESILGRSHCDNCDKNLEPIELIPIISFLWFGRKCRKCKMPLSWAYPISEFMTGISYVLVWLYVQPILTMVDLYSFAILLVITSSLIVILLADIKYQIIPDQIQIAIIITAIFYRMLDWNESFIQLIPTMIFDGLVVTIPLGILFFISKGKWMGFGDVKLSFGMGALLGMTGGFLAIYIAFITGGIIGGFLMLTGKAKRKSRIAFGAFLVVGIATMVFADSLVNQYIGEYIFNVEL